MQRFKNIILFILAALCLAWTYPIKQSSSNPHLLVDQNNVPFQMVGDSPQSLVVNLSESDADFYITDRAQHGFNTLLIDALCYQYTGGPANGALLNGTLPFTNTLSDGSYNLTNENSAYFSYLDTVINLCASNGIEVMLDPIETGGWLDTMLANGTNACYLYGQYLGNRYKGFPNLIWQSGNDYFGGQDDVVTAVMQGIESMDTNHLQTIELSYPVSSSLDDQNMWGFVNLNLAYTYQPTYAEVLDCYSDTNSTAGNSSSGIIPCFLGEANYELETNSGTDGGSPQILRLQEYWTMTSGASGQLYGNHYTWTFDTGWQTNLDTIGMTQLEYMAGLFNSVKWYNLVPDTGHTFVTSGYGTFSSSGSLYGNNYVTAALSGDGTLGIAYIPIATTITVNMTNFAGPVTAQWFDPGDGNYIAISGSPFANSGSQSFTPPGNNSVGGTDWVLLLESSVHSNVTVQFTASPSNGVSRLTVQFRSPAVDSLGKKITNWQWDFGDTTMGSGENPVHIYTNVGTFYPALTVTDTLGLQAATNDSAGILVTNPIIKFTAKPTNVCPHFTIQFTSPNVDSGANRITNWLWNFGDNTTSALENPTHSYASIGTYTPTLAVHNAYGLSPTSLGPTVNVINPTVQFTASPSNGVSRLTVQFRSPTVDSVGVAIKTWHWSFGDGATGTGEDPVHIYTNVGIWFPMLTVTNTVGDSATSSGSITVTNPVIKFTARPTNACPFLKIDFSAPATDSGRNRITSWLWNFGDNTTSTLENPTHIYTNDETYNPALTVFNAYGLSPGSSGPAIVVQNPTVQFTASPSNGVSRLTVQFRSPAVDSVGVAIKTWRWNFGDGSTGTGENPVHVYTNLETYLPVLTVSNALGLFPLSSGPAITVTNPVIKFTARPTNGPVSLAVQFTSPNVDSGGNKITNWFWNFGDDTTSTLESPLHTYTNNGTFHPALTVTNEFGLSPTSSGPAIVAGSGVAAVNDPPLLSISLISTNLILKWPTNNAIYTLQYTPNPGWNAWNNVTSAPVVVNGQNVVTNSISGQPIFFRLNQK